MTVTAADVLADFTTDLKNTTEEDSLKTKTEVCFGIKTSTA